MKRAEIRAVLPCAGVPANRFAGILFQRQAEAVGTGAGVAIAQKPLTGTTQIARRQRAILVGWGFREAFLLLQNTLVAHNQVMVGGAGYVGGESTRADGDEGSQPLNRGYGEVGNGL